MSARRLVNAASARWRVDGAGLAAELLALVAHRSRPANHLLPKAGVGLRSG